MNTEISNTQINEINEVIFNQEFELVKGIMRIHDMTEEEDVLALANNRSYINTFLDNMRSYIRNIQVLLDHQLLIERVYSKVYEVAEKCGMTNEEIIQFIDREYDYNFTEESNTEEIYNLLDKMNIDR